MRLLLKLRSLRPLRIGWSGGPKMRAGSRTVTEKAGLAVLTKSQMACSASRLALQYQKKALSEARASSLLMGTHVSPLMGPARSSSGLPVVTALMEPVTTMDLSEGALAWA